MQTAVARPIPFASNPDLDFLLAQVAEAVQLSEAQHTLAKTRYDSIADWLSAPGSPLTGFYPSIYAQGSMRLGTTVKPRGSVEFDLDLVCELSGTPGSAMEVYDRLHDRLVSRGTYRPLVEKKNRCVRLNYAGEFHLDIIPAVRDGARGGTSVLVPDCERRAWTASNPKGFAEWFRSRSAVALLEKRARADAEPLPAQVAADQKPALAVSVQLLKRARDVRFDGSDDSPRSILLTTLAAHYYSGDRCVATATIGALRGIREAIAAAAPRPIEVINPANTAERFSDCLTPQRYRALREYVADLESRFLKLLATQGIDAVQTDLEGIFGEKPVNAALAKYGELLKSRRDGHRLSYSTAGIGVVSSVSSTRAPRNTYYGD